MSQPPPPPSQPPYGPSQPGPYGPPPPPPNQPPAGHPSPGPYGPPPAQPPPGQPQYGQPQYGQPPYGPPPGHPAGPPPGPPGIPGGSGGPGGQGGGPVGPGDPGGLSRKALGIVAGVVAVVLIAGGIFLFTGDDGGSGSGGDEAGGGSSGKVAKQLFTVKAKGTAGKDDPGADGSWFTEKIYAKSTINAIEGYRINSGKRAWRLPLGGPVCDASPHMTDDNRTAVAVEKDGEGCDTVVVFNVESGKKMWEKPIPKGETIFGGMTNLTVAENTVAISWNGGFVAYGIDGGPPVWKSKSTGETCEHERYGGGAKLLVVLECDNDSLTLNRLDPKTGHNTWDVRLPAGLDGGRSVRIIDTDPVVLVLGTGDETASEVMTIDDNGKIATTIGLGERREKYEPGCMLGDMGSEACFNIVATDDKVFVATKERDGGELSKTNEVMAFDFHTGRPVWKSSAGNERTTYPITTVGKKAIAYNPPTFDKGAEVTEIEPERGKRRTLMRLPDASREQQDEFRVPSMGFAAPVSYSNGRLFLQDGNPSSEDGSAALLAMGFAAR